MITILDYINGNADLKIAAYGTSAGVTESWNNRPRAAPKILMHQEETPVDAKYMQLSLKVHGIPLLFENDDNFNWNWSADKKTLHIENAETKTDDALGYAQKEVYDIPAENIKEWAPSEGEQWKN